jgi:hypothetical protein
MAGRDILLLPKYLVPEAVTPHAPGQSVHMVFEIGRDPPHPEEVSDQCQECETTDSRGQINPS